MTVRPPLFLGAYAASPNSDPDHWEPLLEEEFFRGLSTISGIQGLELPFYGKLHPHDSHWLIRNFDPKWNAVLTCLPGTMNRLKSDPRFGLASPDEESRQAALQFIRSAQRAVIEFNQALGRNAVHAIQIHSAPTARANPESFLKSLREIQTWEWMEAELWVEHCDAYVEGQFPAKGFLSLEEEVLSVRDFPQAGICINWGRSAIEGRNPSAVLHHLKLAAGKRRLKALFFSGASQGHPLYGDWKDSHAPFALQAMKARDPDHFEGLLLTEERVLECLNAVDIGKLSALGIKIQTLPASLSVAERLQWVRESVEFLDLCCSKASSPGMRDL